MPEKGKKEGERLLQGGEKEECLLLQLRSLISRTGRPRRGKKKKEERRRCDQFFSRRERERDLLKKGRRKG